MKKINKVIFSIANLYVATAVILFLFGLSISLVVQILLWISAAFVGAAIVMRLEIILQNQAKIKETQDEILEKLKKLEEKN